MKTTLKWLILFISLTSYQKTEAQFFKKLKNSVEQKLTRKAEDKVNQEVDQKIEDITSEKENSKEKQTTKNTSTKTNETLTIPATEIYQFTHETFVMVTSLDDNKTYKMSYLLNPNKTYMGLKADMSEYSNKEIAGESIIIMDDGTTYVFVETQGMKIQMSQSMMGNKTKNPTDQMANYDYTNLTKTGKTKKVLGAKCYEYTMSDDNVKMNLWVAPDIDLPNWFVQNNEVLKGHIMEYTIKSKDGNMKSETIAIEDNISKTINPTAYKKMF